jgi:replicative DNA helicase
MYHDTEAEQAVLGACLIDDKAIAYCCEHIQDNMFANNKHRIIYENIIYLFNANKGVDILTLTNRLKNIKKLKKVTPAYIPGLLESAGHTAAAIEYHCNILVEKYQQRQLQTLAKKIEQKLKSKDETEEIKTFAQERILKITQHTEKDKMRHIMKILASELDHIDKIHSGQVEGGIKTDYYHLDRLTNGLHPGELITIAGRVKQGKTTLALNMAKNIALYGKRVVFFSLEMTEQELVRRLICNFAQISMGEIFNPKDDTMENIVLASEIISQLPLYIEDTPGLNVFQLKSKILNIMYNVNIDIVFIDLFQKIKTHVDGGDTYRREQISRSLADMAKELNLPIILIAQVNRGAADSEPKLWMIKDTGAIEEDSHKVIFIHRPGFYDGNDVDNRAKIIVAANRNGNTGSGIMGWQGEFFNLKNEVDKEETRLPY